MDKDYCGRCSCSVVCLLVFNATANCKSRCTDRDPVWGGDCWGPGYIVLDWGPDFLLWIWFAKLLWPFVEITLCSLLCTAVDATVSDGEGQSSVDTSAASAPAAVSATDTEPGRRQSRSLSIIARAFGKGLDSRRPSTVAAVFAAATSNLAPPRWSRRGSSTRPSTENLVEESSVRPRKLTANSVTWKEAGNPVVGVDQQTDRNANVIVDSQTRGGQSNALWWGHT